MRREFIEATGSCGNRLIVEFFWCTDRFAQLISVADASGNITPLLESLEGAATDAWPSSPPLQSLGLETLPDGRRAALLVGMAGGSYWSASVEQIVGKAALTFDIACRHSKTPAFLGNRYRRLAEAATTMEIAGEEVLVIEQESGVEIQRSGVVRSVDTTRWKFHIEIRSPGTEY